MKEVPSLHPLHWIVRIFCISNRRPHLIFPRSPTKGKALPSTSAVHEAKILHQVKLLGHLEEIPRSAMKSLWFMVKWEKGSIRKVNIWELNCSFHLQISFHHWLQKKLKRTEAPSGFWPPGIAGERERPWGHTWWRNPTLSGYGWFSQLPMYSITQYNQKTAGSFHFMLHGKSKISSSKILKEKSSCKKVFRLCTW